MDCCGGGSLFMEPRSTYSPTLSDETLRKLPDGRTLAYRICGETAANCKQVVFAFHGALGTGDFDHWSYIFQKLGWLVISPTLPGWGLSSANPCYTLNHYAKYDIKHLTDHIFDTVLGSNTKLERSFLCIGISYGCIHAIACAVHLSEQVSGLCLLGPHGPFDDPSFDPLQGMAFQSKLGLGTVGFYMPSMTSITGKMVQTSVSTPSKAREFVKTNLLDAMNDAEKQHFAAASKDLQNKVASGEGIRDSLSVSIQGYVDIPVVLRSWSVKDLQKIECPSHIFVANDDVQTPVHGARYIHEKLQEYGKRSKLTEFDKGGHMTLVFCFDECLEAFVKESSESS
ncbi:expressed unknown protein [Seminavis robusta]|uniref:AB hydrolase-1 domain-containing protein n=1 Tax=Seminavis robusta TaxID=568900 RepID=A0A9N8HFD4_9STRA|nr:expressed unknown protein [Seminavis robusta]|eukprot:Sro450_g145470.1 n/a (341) ;mRNA; r:7644-8666